MTEGFLAQGEVPNALDLLNTDTSSVKSNLLASPHPYKETERKTKLPTVVQLDSRGPRICNPGPICQQQQTALLPVCARVLRPCECFTETLAALEYTEICLPLSYLWSARITGTQHTQLRNPFLRRNNP